MGTSTDPQNRESPEQRVGRLVAQLRNHALWDSLLIFSPPLLFAIYLAVYLYRGAWIAPIAFLLLSGAMIGVGLLAVVVRTRPLIPSVRSAARLVDEKTKAKDRFLTLATIDVALWPAALVGRLRSEAATLLERIDFRREFPYRIKRSFYWSFLVSFIAAALFHLSMPLMGSTRRQAPAYGKLSEIAEKMVQRPPLSVLAHDLRTLAMKLEHPNVAEQEKQTLIHKTLEQVERQQKKEEEEESRALLGEASSTLQGLEQQSARSQQKDAEKGGRGAQSNPSQEGQGEGKQSRGGGGDSKGELNAERSKDMQQGQGPRGDSKEQGKEKNQQSQRDGKNNQPDPSNKSDQDTGKELTGKTPGGSQEKLGRSRSEEIPQGAPPPERFYQPGEQGKEGVKGARYVTVQLPEELAADSKGEGTISKPSKETKAYPKTPVSNAPLPAHVPDAPTEKQQLPLEYRGIIR
jgi:hypothetical protein